MGNFCKGIMLGAIAGICVGAIVVAKNKKLSNKLKEGLTTAEGKIKEIKQDIEEKINSETCGCGSENCSPESENCDCGEESCDCNEPKNNFSKKNKNC